ncbi:hypothetical protein NDU88_004532 [Pleurodeles waltl]|uniref:Uncharacterized protein n=1 Tax=Pleurodeles waltl TaxID=8319 RepID=A0AAV7WS83_PLEWA|nr:hypothetical protein NDU88_004532 [Pleurodeles waltl]
MLLPMLFSIGTKKKCIIAEDEHDDVSFQNFHNTSYYQVAGKRSLERKKGSDWREKARRDGIVRSQNHTDGVTSVKDLGRLNYKSFMQHRALRANVPVENKYT